MYNLSEFLPTEYVKISTRARHNLKKRIRYEKFHFESFDRRVYDSSNNMDTALDLGDLVEFDAKFYTWRYHALWPQDCQKIK